MGQKVKNHPASPYPRPSARVATEGSRVRVSGCGLGLALPDWGKVFVTVSACPGPNIGTRHGLWVTW